MLYWIILSVLILLAVITVGQQDVGFQPPAIVYFGNGQGFAKMFLPNMKGRFPLNFGASIKDDSLQCDPIFLQDVSLCSEDAGCKSECLERALQQGGTQTPPCLIMPEARGKCTQWEQAYAAYEAGYKAIFMVRGYNQNPVPLKLDFDDAEAWRLAFEMQDMVIVSMGYDFNKRVYEQMRLPKPQSSLQIDGSLHILKTKKPRITLLLGSNYNCPGACSAAEWIVKNMTDIFSKWLVEDRVQMSVHFPPGEGCFDGDQCHKYNCMRHRRYCAPDPDGATWSGYTGKDAAVMSVRLSCIWKEALRQGQSSSFFPFLSAWIDTCQIASSMYDEKCTTGLFQQFFRVSDMDDRVWSNIVGSVQQCVGDPDLDAIHQTAREDNNIAGVMGWVVPGLGVNNQLMGTLLTKQNALDSICEAFEDGIVPQECFSALLQADQCQPDQIGHEECMHLQDGRMRCEDTFTGYQCVCDYQRGYVPQDPQRPSESTCVSGSTYFNKGHISGWAVFGIILLVANILGATLYIISRKTIKQYIENKTKDILKQYMTVNDKFERAELIGSDQKEQTIPAIQVELPNNPIAFSARFS